MRRTVASQAENGLRLARQDDPGVGAVDVGAAAVGLGDGSTIARPSPVPPPGARIAAAEALEGARQEVRREAGALVADASSTEPSPPRRAESDDRPCPWRRALSTRLPSAWSSRRRSPSTRRRRRPRPLERPPGRRARGPKRRATPSSSRRPRTGSRRSGSCRRSAARAGADRRRAAPGGRSPRRPSAARRSSSSGDRGAAQRELELGREQGERRAQLVARVGDEAPLALERRPRGGRASRSASRRAGGSRRSPAAPAAALPGSAAEIASGRRRIASTGRSAAPASR